jgi:type II secretory pathway component PulF
MALYSYQAFSKQGKKITGYIEAPTLQAARDQLARQGLFPSKIEVTTEESRQSWWRRFFGGGISFKDKILFTKQLTVLLKSGIPLLQALELMVDQFQGNFRSVLVAVKDDIKEGTSFADALKKYPKIFDTIYVQLVRAGEASGKLEKILDRLTDYLERREEIRKKISSAMQYPMIQLAVAVLVVGGLLIFVVPSMVKNFKDQELPASTQLLLSITDFIIGHYLLLIFSIIAMIIGFNYWRKTPKGAWQFDNIKLHIPLVKHFVKTNAVVQFSYTLGILLESGVNLSQALDIVISIIDNRVLKDTLSDARDKIIKQGNIAQYLKQTNIFPPIAIHLISTGEQSGQLDNMLLTIASNYEEDLKDLADSLAAWLTPILLLVMALIIGFIVISMAQPILQMGKLAGI